MLHVLFHILIISAIFKERQWISATVFGQLHEPVLWCAHIISQSIFEPQSLADHWELCPGHGCDSAGLGRSMHV